MTAKDILFFEYQDFNQVPSLKGIYAFYLNLGYTRRMVGNENAAASFTANKFLGKMINAHTLSTPGPSTANLYGKPTKWSNMMDIQLEHRLSIPEDTFPREMLIPLSDILSRATIFTPPIYIGITGSQNFHQRLSNHRTSYQRLKKKHSDSTVCSESPEAPFGQGGEFYKKLIRRGIEFRDLLFACLPLKKAELEQIKTAEKILQATTNPTLSESH